MTTTTSTPGGYTSRFVAHVAHGQTTAHDEATSNSSNPLDRDRFRTFSADGTDEWCSAGLCVDDGKLIADADSAYDVDADGDAVKSQATSSARTDVTADESTTSSTSSHLAISEPENLLGGGRGDSRIAGVTAEDENALGHYGNGGTWLVAAGRTQSTEHDLDARRNGADKATPEKRDFEDVPSSLRIIVEDVDAPVAEKSNSASQTVEMIDERRDRSRSKESHSVSECSSSVSGRTMSDSESESDSESGSEEEGEVEDEEEDESRDENCNVKSEKRGEGKKNDGNYGDQDSAKGEEKNKDSLSAESDEEAVLSIGSNTQGEGSAMSDDRYERDLKRRSASIIDERSIEEMFDDNGWVVTEQDLEQDLQADPQIISAIPLDFKSTADRPSEETPDSIGDPAATEGSIPRVAEERRDETSSNLEDFSASIIDDAEVVPSSERSDILPRSHVYRQSSLGKNGWLVSDESESESDRTTSPIEASSGRGTARIESANGAVEIDGIEEYMGDIDENGWVILDDDSDDDDDDDVDGERLGDNSAQETTSTIRSRTTDLVNSKTNIENGALVANVVTRSKGTSDQSEPDEHEEASGASMSIPMQMVTTVLCVSVLCYSVLTNLFP